MGAQLAKPPTGGVPTPKGRQASPVGGFFIGRKEGIGGALLQPGTLETPR